MLQIQIQNYICCRFSSKTIYVADSVPKLYLLQIQFHNYIQCRFSSKTISVADSVPELYLVHIQIQNYMLQFQIQNYNYNYCRFSARTTSEWLRRRTRTVCWSAGPTPSSPDADTTSIRLDFSCTACFDWYFNSFNITWWPR